MTQKHLNSLTYEIKSTLKDNTPFDSNTEESLTDDNKVIETDEKTVVDDDTAIETFENALKKKKKKKKKTKKETPDRDADSERNLIRKVEMILDYETEIHIYEDKFKIIVKKQTPFYISKKTWKLMLQRHKTINTASTLTEITGSSLSEI